MRMVRTRWKQNGDKITEKQMWIVEDRYWIQLLSVARFHPVPLISASQRNGVGWLGRNLLGVVASDSVKASLEGSEESAQYVDISLVPDSHCWRGYDDGMAKPGWHTNLAPTQHLQIVQPIESEADYIAKANLS